MAKLTTRDYKSTQRRSPDFRRLREFGYGMLAGIVVASMAFVYLGGTPRKIRDSADAPRPDPHRPAPAKIERPGVYVLQAGSYRNETDADRVRAQLALQGVDARVQRVAVDADVWHRVRIGPISNLDELNKVRRQLRAAEVDALVIRVGD